MPNSMSMKTKERNSWMNRRKNWFDL